MTWTGPASVVRRYMRPHGAGHGHAGHFEGFEDIDASSAAGRHRESWLPATITVFTPCIRKALIGARNSRWCVASGHGFC